MHTQIFSFLSEVRTIYLEHFKEFKSSLNLKQTRSDHLFADSAIFDSFSSTLSSYSEKIDDFQSKILELSFNYPDLFISMRKKNYDSIASKLDKNKENKFPILKILNDVFGARCFVQNCSDIVSNLKLLCDDSHFRFVDKTDNDNIPYKAWHVYIKGNNNFIFFIELQIWDVVHVESNLASHKIYKTAYTQAPAFYNEVKNND